MDGSGYRVRGPVLRKGSFPGKPRSSRCRGGSDIEGIEGFPVTKSRGWAIPHEEKGGGVKIKGAFRRSIPENIAQSKETNIRGI